MIDNKNFAKLRPEDLLQRAYALKSPEEAIDLYRDWAGSYDQQLERGLRYVAPAVISQLLSVAEPDPHRSGARCRLWDRPGGCQFIEVGICSPGWARFFLSDVK